MTNGDTTTVPQPRQHRRSDTIGKLAEALAKAQGEIRNAPKDQANPYYSSKYADLAGVMDCCRAPLAANGLAVLQFPRAMEGGIEVETVLAHSSGEWVSESLWLPATMRAKDGKERFDAQSIGSAITYARRYALAAVVGVAAEDDDGNAAAKGVQDQRERWLAILRAAANDGIDDLTAAWKSLPSNEARKACQPDMPALKKLAEGKKEAAHA